MSRGQDLLGVIRGLQSVAQASLKIQETNWNVLWKNSSIRSTANEIVGKASNPQNFNRNNLEEITKTINETSGRIYTVLHGVKEFVAYTTTSKATYTSPPKETVHKPEPKQCKNKYEIKLTHSDKKLLEKLDMEHKEKLKAEALKEKECGAKKEKQKVEAKKIEEDAIRMVENLIPELQIAEEPRITVVPNPKSRQALSSTSKQRTVPSSRISRMVSFGSLAAGLGIGTAAEYARRTFGLSDVSDTVTNLFLTQANMDRIVDTLCKVRGAALKIGQILSIQDESIVSPALAKALERVRKSADFMPNWQVEKVMQSELGEQWRLHFIEFEETPFAAASIGQVHWGRLRDGQQVAIKIQYPGVAKGIESDIDNLVGIMKVWNIFPKGMFIDNLVVVAKRELAWEVDYLREAECTKKFRKLLEPYPDYYVPKVIDRLCTSQVFTAEFVEGIPVDQCLHLHEEHKRIIAKKVMDLCLLELMEFNYMQTDPNWANFLYNTEKRQLVLLDFGASREYSKNFVDKYVMIMKAASEGDRESVLKFSRELGFLTGYESKVMEDAHVDAVMILGEVFRHPDEFNFDAHDTTARIQNLVPTMLDHRLCPPPEEIYSLHRKLSGVFLLCAKLKVPVAMRNTFLQLYNNYKF